MFNKLKEYLMSLISSRIIYLLVFYSVLFGILIYRIFDMQIIRGEDYINNFEMKQKKERFIDAARGNIYDCNGVLLAYNKLAYSVTIEDVYESGKKKNENLNKTIYKTINIIEENGDTIDIDFGIGLDEDNNYQFTLSGARLSRFKADIYGEAYVDNMTYAQASSSPDEIIEYLAGDDKFNISEMGVSKEMTLKMAAIRYAMSLNAYQKYISTVISTDVSDKTVAVIYENSNILRGVNISEDTIRVYPNGKYTAQIVGYTGKINSDE
nr:penicillin-binding protein [Lachnospiraceae bacterium]